MSTKTKIVSILIGIAVIGCGYFLLNNQRTTNISSSTPISQSDWETYENTAFGYRIRYPSGTNLDPLDRYDYITPITEKGEISLGLVYVIAWRNMAETGFSVEENKYFIGLDLKSFAQAMRMYSINDPNPNIRNIRVGDLQEMIFASTTAYSFTLSGEFVRAVGNASHSDAPYRYIFFENPNKEKFTIWYPEDDPISNAIVESFAFSN